jgi:hypothetical protein
MQITDRKAVFAQIEECFSNNNEARCVYAKFCATQITQIKITCHWCVKWHDFSVLAIHGRVCQDVLAVAVGPQNTVAQF